MDDKGKSTNAGLRDIEEVLKSATELHTLVFASRLTIYSVGGGIVLSARVLRSPAGTFISSFLVIAAISACRGTGRTHMFGQGWVGSMAASVAATLVRLPRLLDIRVP